MAVLAATMVAAVFPVAAAAQSEDPPLPRRPGEYEVIEQHTTPSAEVAADATTVGIASDSIGWDLTNSIARTVEATFPITYNESILGGTIRRHRVRVVKAVRSASGPDVLVVILGTAEANNLPSSAEFVRDMRGFLDDVVPHVDCVRWFDTQSADASGIYKEFNASHRRISDLIHRVTAEYQNVEYYHYGAWTEIAPPGYIEMDQLHLAAAGRIELGRMIVQAAKGCDGSTDVAGFWDVKTGYWAQDAITWISGEGLASGFPNRTYRAVIGGLDANVTRGQLARMVWRLVGSPMARSPHGWSDGQAWLQEALDWLKESGLADGYPNGTFRPDADITRGEVLRMLWRIAGSPVAGTAHPWSDGTPWINDSLNWAAEQSLLSGFGDGTVRPSARITRAQIARLLFRFDALPAPPPVAAPTEPSAPTPESTAPGPPRPGTSETTTPGISSTAM